jgi:hypothetical protein
MWLVAAGAAVGMVLASIGISAAQTSGSDTGEVTAAEQPAPDGDEARGPGPGMRRHRGPGGPGGGLGKGAIHGEFTVKNGDDGYRTLATQRGEVAAVSSSSITVKSEDGFSRSYTVNDDTLVNAGNDGIDDVKVGDTVHVTAVVEDGKARAVDIHDRTQVKALREKWMPERPDRAAKDSTTSTTAA